MFLKLCNLVTNFIINLIFIKILQDLAEPRKPVSMAAMGTVSTVLGRLMATGVTDEGNLI